MHLGRPRFNLVSAFTQYSRSIHKECTYPIESNLNLTNKGTEMNKAQQVQTEYDHAAWYNRSSDGCYALAVAAAIDLGGVEVYNINDDNSLISFAPTRDFEFDDGSYVHVTYGGVFVLASATC